MTRSFPGAFNESRYIALIIYNLMAVFTVVAVIWATNPDRPSLVYTFSTLAIFWVSAFNQFTLLSQKLYLVFYPPPESYFQTHGGDIASNSGISNKSTSGGTGVPHKKVSAANNNSAIKEDDQEKDQLRNTVMLLTKEVSELRAMLRQYRSDLPPSSVRGAPKYGSTSLNDVPTTSQSHGGAGPAAVPLSPVSTAKFDPTDSNV
jgi:hypothetical protein